MKVYEDEGDTLGFRQGQFSYTPVRSQRRGDRQTIFVGPVEGNFPGQLPARSYELRLVRCLPPKEVKVNGASWPYSEKLAPGAWSYDGPSLSLIVRTPPQPLAKPLAVEIVHDGADAACLNGIAGALGRLFIFAKFLSTIRNYWIQDIWNDGYQSSDVAVRTAEAGYAITRRPQAIRTELEALNANLPRIIGMLETSVRRLAAGSDWEKTAEPYIREIFPLAEIRSRLMMHLKLLQSIGRPWAEAAQGGDFQLLRK